jgi:hypothetical protein
MLRSTGRLLRFNYNNYNNWRRFYKNYEPQTEPVAWKRDFKEGDQAEFAYNTKVVWPDNYRPWSEHLPAEYALGVVLIILYVDWRTDRIREKEGITETNPYPI